MRRPTQSKRDQSRYATRMASDFQAAALHNKVDEDVGEDDQLAQILDAKVTAGNAKDQRVDDVDADAHAEAIDQAAGRLSYVAEERARECVALACQTILEDGEEWVASGHWEPEQIHEAQQEAREWLTTYTNVSSRLGLLPVEQNTGADAFAGPEP